MSTSAKSRYSATVAKMSTTSNKISQQNKDTSQRLSKQDPKRVCKPSRPLYFNIFLQNQIVTHFCFRFSCHLARYKITIVFHRKRTTFHYILIPGQTRIKTKQLLQNFSSGWNCYVISCIVFQQDQNLPFLFLLGFVLFSEAFEQLVLSSKHIILIMQARICT